MTDIRFGAINTFRFNLPSREALPEKYQGQESALKTDVIGEVLYELSRYEDRATRSVPHPFELREQLNRGALAPEDVVILSNDKPMDRQDDERLPGNDASRHEARTQALYEKHRPESLRDVLNMPEDEREAALEARRAYREDLRELEFQYKEAAVPVEVNVQVAEPGVGQSPRLAFEIPALNYRSIHFKPDAQ